MNLQLTLVPPSPPPTKSDTAIVEQLRQAREKPGLPFLMVEATEGGLLNVNRANRIIQRLRELDISVAIDDFGTGYSSLSYRGALEAAYLKIDKSFVSAIGSDAVTRPVIDRIVAMANDCDLMLIAEGVESEEQVTYLHEVGVQYAQGWLFGRPLPPNWWLVAGKTCPTLNRCRPIGDSFGDGRD